MLSQAIQDYLKTIYKLQDKGPVATTQIAKQLNISGASVTGMLKRLSTMGMVEYNSYKGAKLTETGEKIALEILRHHRLIELYLKEELGYSLEKVHEEACRLEHHVSEEFVRRIDEKLGSPEFSPLGNPIPNKHGLIVESDAEPLANFNPGETLVIRRLSDADKKMLAYFEENNLLPGVELKITQIAPFNGPVTVTVDGENKILGNEIAKNIFVEAVNIEENN